MNQHLFSMPASLWATVFLLFPALLALNLLLCPREGADVRAAVTCFARRAAGGSIVLVYVPLLAYSASRIRGSGPGADVAALHALFGLIALLPVALLVAAGVYRLALAWAARRAE